MIASRVRAVVLGVALAGVSCIHPPPDRPPGPEGGPPGIHGPVDEAAAPPSAVAGPAGPAEPAGPAAGDEPAAGHRLPHRFARAEEWVARFEGPDRDAWQKPEHVVELLRVEPGMTVADLGAGTGYFLPYLSRAVGETGHVLALDVEEDMVRHMDRRVEEDELFNVRPRLVAPDDPGLADASVDRVLVVNVWHHVAGRPAYAARLARALRPGGSLCIVEPTRDSPVGPSPAERLDPGSVAAELRDAGLEPEVLAEDLPNQYVVVGRKR